MPRSPEPQLVRRLEMPANNDTPSSDSESDGGAQEAEEVYEVEAIRASRFDGHTSAMRYLVKWKGYGEDEKTWEPIENLENCLDLVTEYNKRKEEREARRASITPGGSLTDALNKSARLPAASGNESSDQGVSMKELDERRAKAKKKQSSTGSTSARAEDAVADRWEKKATSKEQKRKSSSSAASASPVASTSKAPIQPPQKKKKVLKTEATADKPKQKKRAVEEAKATPPPAKKPKKARPVVASDSSDESDSGAAAKARKKQSTPAAAITTSTQTSATTDLAVSSSTTAKPPPAPPATATAAAPTASTSAQRLPPEPAPQQQQVQADKQQPLKAALAPIIDETMPQARPTEPVPQGPWAGALGKLLSKSFRKPPPPPPPPHVEQPAPVGDGRVRFQEEPVRFTQSSASPRHSTAAQPHSALRQSSLQPSPIETSRAATVRSVSPHVHAQPASATTDPRRHPQGSPAPVAPYVNGHDSRAASPAETKPQVHPPPTQAAVDDAAAREKKIKDRATQLQNLENRLRKSSWFQLRPEFTTEDLTVACTLAIPIDPHLVMRLKGKGVAVLVSHGRDETVSGEGLALAYLLMRMGATTPRNMQEVEAVCIHRKEPLAALEALYCELVNLERHFVEFFYFGGDELCTPVFAHGYHVLPTLAALQQGAAFDRFCQFSRDPDSRHCVVAVHPATVAMARMEVNWPRIYDSLTGHQIDLIGREMIKLDSAFATVEKSDLLERTVTFRPLPQVTPDSEFAEILSHSVHARAQYSTVWRRFIVVVSEVADRQVQKARACGVEVHTWSTLAELVAASPFG